MGTKSKKQQAGEKDRKRDLCLLAAEVDNALGALDRMLELKVRHDDIAWSEIRQNLEDVVDGIIAQI